MPILRRDPGDLDLRRDTAVALRAIADEIEDARLPRWFVAQTLKIVHLAQRLRGVVLGDAQGAVGPVRTISIRRPVSDQRVVSLRRYQGRARTPSPIRHSNRG